METNLATALKEFREALHNDPRVIELNKLEQKLYEDPELVKLVLKKNAIEDEYQEAINIYGEKSDRAKAMEKSLYEAKLALDLNPTAKAYSDAFIIVRDLYMRIDDIIYSPFRHKSVAEEL